MRDIMKLAVRLFIFSLVAAIGLAVTNEVTKGPIAEQKIAAQKEALNKVLPGCNYEEIVEIEGLAEGSLIDQMFVGKSEETGEIAGYAFVANPQGYGGPIPITLGVSTEGHVTQTYVGALQETAGLGSKVGEAEFQEQFIAIAADPDTLSDDVDTIGGATVSSSAFIGAVSEILSYTKNTLGIAPNAGDKEAVLAAAAAAAGAPAEPVITANTYDVTGFGPIKVEVAVDDAGKIASVTVLEHNETPGFGADLIADTAVFDALVGQDIAGAQIDVKAGVTLTSKAINSALKQAGPQVPADPYTVKGFDKFTINIAVQDGVIASASVAAHNETPGFGADILTEDALAVLVGQNLADAAFDVKAGVTLTSTAINNAIKQAAAAHGIVVEEPVAEETAPVEEAPTKEAETASEIPVYEVTGFMPMKVAIEVGADGKIVSAQVLEHNETPGFGADLIASGALEAVVGQDAATAQIDAKAGVTLTSNALNDALKQAGAAAPAAESAEAAAIAYSVTGFQPFTVEIAVDADGKIASVAVPSHSETPGFGADLIASGVLDALVGQDAATAQIDAKAGVTLTSNALNDALKQAGAAAPVAETSEAVAVAYSVTGFMPFTVEIAVDAEGKIASVAVPSHSETPGFGADLIASGVLETVVGQDAASAQIEAKAGVTLTSNALNDALKQAGAAAPAAEAAVEAKSYSVTGFMPFTVEIAVDGGKIVSVSVPSHSETPGFGADLIASGVLDALVGQDIASAQIDAKAGVTLTSNAINDALAQAAKEVQ